MRLSRAACCTWKELVEDGSKMDLSVVWHTVICISRKALQGCGNSKQPVSGARKATARMSSSNLEAFLDCFIVSLLCC